MGGTTLHAGIVAQWFEILTHEDTDRHHRLERQMHFHHLLWETCKKSSISDCVSSIS